MLVPIDFSYTTSCQ